MVAQTPSMELAFLPRSEDTRLSIEQLISQIQSVNPTATAPFLTRFNKFDLLHYIERLALIGQNRSRWVRHSDSPGVARYSFTGKWKDRAA